MKILKKTNLLLLITSCLILCSCNNESIEELNSDNNTVEIKAQEYLKYISELEKEYPNLPIEHELNYKISNQHNLSDLLNNSTQIFSDPNPEVSANIRSFASPAIYGPWGGNRGDVNISAIPNPNSGEKWWKISALRIRSEKYLDGIQVFWTSNTGNKYNSNFYGGNGGKERIIYFAPDEFIQIVQISAGRFVDRLTFVTNKQIYTFGGNGGSDKVELNFSIAGEQLHGFFGKSGIYIDRIGFYCYDGNIFK